MIQYIFFPDTVQTPQVLPIDYALIMLAMICITAVLVAMVWPSSGNVIHRYSLPDFRAPKLPVAPPPLVPPAPQPSPFYDPMNGILDSIYGAIPTAGAQPQPPLKKNYRPKMSSGKRFRVLRRDGFRCQLCGRTAADGIELHIDHKMPLAKGGSNQDDNLWTLCGECNGGKSDTIVDEILENSADATEVE